MNFGYNVLVLSAGVGAIPAEVMEAARLDGATGWRLARRIILPLLSPQLFFLVVVSTIQSLQSFGQIHILTKGGPDQVHHHAGLLDLQEGVRVRLQRLRRAPARRRSCCC